MMWLILFLLACAVLAVIFLLPGFKAIKESLTTVEKMKSTGDSMTARMNDVKTQQQLLQGKKEYLRYDLHQKKNSFTTVKEAFSDLKHTFQKIKN
ncbi:hypothetical protein KUV80_07300 [Fictibacillus nanhaiensis]|uniref:hypothetical protein n=1 Tax=Fictibacillus nanhaiensis TaxID=742169 RepID=UPI001C958E5E|nr:hypothetical protein [Fictibacillus nanhaiensis]MBY6036452.1 hypothetical protein [Fictibacillus nanhaiensis]